MFRGFFNNAARAAKSFASIGGFSGWGGNGYQGVYGFNNRPLAGSTYDYRREAGCLWENSAVMACVNWAVRNFPEAPLQVQRLKDGVWEVEETHPAIDLLSSPNNYYDSSCLFSTWVANWMLGGNVYSFVERRRDVGWPTAVYSMPYFQVAPRWDNGEGKNDRASYILDYLYRTGQKEISLNPSQVLHLRNGLSFENQRVGISPLTPVLREICSDNEASTAAAAIMRNMGMPGLAFIPADKDQEIPQTHRDAIRRLSRERFTGDSRGETLVLPVPGQLTPVGFSPEDMAFDAIRRVPEARICSVLGIPPIVVGLTAGLERSTFSNYKESREAAIENCLIPMWRVFAQQLSHQLLPMWDEDPAVTRFHFNVSEVAALAENQNERNERIREDFNGGVITLAEARMERGHVYESDADRDAEHLYKWQIDASTDKSKDEEEVEEKKEDQEKDDKEDQNKGEK